MQQYPPVGGKCALGVLVLVEPRREGRGLAVDLRVGQRSLQLVMEVHGFLQELAVYKVTSREATKVKAVCQATFREANIRA
jgi:hypothetical protein